LGVTVGTIASLLENLDKRLVIGQDRGRLICRSNSLVIASFQSIHALMEGRLRHPFAVCQFDDFTQAPRSGGLGLLEYEVAS
jgi:hypothetical protein